MNASSPGSQKTEPVSYTLVLKNKLDELTKLSDWSNALASQLGISADGAFRLDLVLTEAVNNIIQYAYERGEKDDIIVTLRRRKAEVEVEVQDHGRPFDPLQNPEVMFPRSLEDASEGGLGIHLIRTYTDECRYRREDHKNILTMMLKTLTDDS